MTKRQHKQHTASYHQACNLNLCCLIRRRLNRTATNMSVVTNSPPQKHNQQHVWTNRMFTPIRLAAIMNVARNRMRHLHSFCYCSLFLLHCMRQHVYLVSHHGFLTKRLYSNSHIVISFALCLSKCLSWNSPQILTFIVCSCRRKHKNIFICKKLTRERRSLLINEEINMKNIVKMLWIKQKYMKKRMCNNRNTNYC